MVIFNSYVKLPEGSIYSNFLWKSSEIPSGHGLPHPIDPTRPDPVALEPSATSAASSWNRSRARETKRWKTVEDRQLWIRYMYTYTVYINDYVYIYNYVYIYIYIYMDIILVKQ